MSLLKRDNAMSKPPGYAFSGTTGDIVHLIQNLPSKPNKKFLEDWTDITHPEARKNSDNINTSIKKQGCACVLTLQRRDHRDLTEKIIGTFTIPIRQERRMNISTKTPILQKKVPTRHILYRKDKVVN